MTRVTGKALPPNAKPGRSLPPGQVAAFGITLETQISRFPVRCHRPTFAPWHFSLLALIILLASCQGTQFGTALEEAVAPATPPPPERTLDDSEAPDPNGGELDPPTPDTTNPNDLDASDSESPEQDPAPLTRPEDTSPESPTDLDRVPDGNSPDVEGGSRFVDLDIEPQTAEAIAALDALGVFADIEHGDFQPNRSVRRQEFARWVTLAYNAVYVDDPDRQLSLADDSETPLFLDVPEDRPEFPHIQALANAGIVEMRADREFEPENLLSRADLIAIKVALDLGADNVEGRLEDVERDWAFSDASDIRAGDIPAIATDFTLGEASNIRRTFGIQDNFAPQAPVTRAQVALVLSSFGIGEEQRSVLAVDELPPADIPSPADSEAAPTQSDDDLPQSTKNPQTEEPPSNDARPEPESEGEREATTSEEPTDVPLDESGRFLDL